MDDYVLGIGAANIDIYGKSAMKIRLHYDHPAAISSSVGGVTRNIIGNLRKLGVSCRMMTAIGDDSFGQAIIGTLKNEGIDTEGILVAEGRSSGVFMQVMDELNDMYLAMCDMSVLEDLSPEYLRDKADLIRKAKLVVCDPSIRVDALEELFEIAEGSVPIFVDPISDNYALKLKPYVSRFTGIKPNRSELEALSGMEAHDEDSLYEAASSLLEKGLKRLYVSLGKNGVLYMDSEGKRIRRKLKPVEDMVNASGAGDAFYAGILYGQMNGIGIEEALDYGLAAGKAATCCKETINPDLSIDLLKNILKEN